MSKDEWLSGCGACPGETRTTNLTLHFVKGDPSCVQARFHGMETEPNYRGGEDFVVARATVARQMGWCRCGDNERVDALMLAYLDSLERYWAWVHAREGRTITKEEWKTSPESDLDRDVYWLMAYIADELDWTEHGSSVVGAWLTEDGKEALANLRKPVYAH